MSCKICLPTKTELYSLAIPENDLALQGADELAVANLLQEESIFLVQDATRYSGFEFWQKLKFIPSNLRPIAIKKIVEKIAATEPVHDFWGAYEFCAVGNLLSLLCPHQEKTLAFFEKALKTTPHWGERLLYLQILFNHVSAKERFELYKKALKSETLRDVRLEYLSAVGLELILPIVSPSQQKELEEIFSLPVQSGGKEILKIFMPELPSLRLDWEKAINSEDQKEKQKGMTILLHKLEQKTLKNTDCQIFSFINVLNYLHRQEKTNQAGIDLVKNFLFQPENEDFLQQCQLYSLKRLGINSMATIWTLFFEAPQRQKTLEFLYQKLANEPATEEDFKTVFLNYLVCQELGKKNTIHQAKIFSIVPLASRNKIRETARNWFDCIAYSPELKKFILQSAKKEPVFLEKIGVTDYLSFYQKTNDPAFLKLARETKQKTSALIDNPDLGNLFRVSPEATDFLLQELEQNLVYDGGGLDSLPKAFLNYSRDNSVLLHQLINQNKSFFKEERQNKKFVEIFFKQDYLFSYDNFDAFSQFLPLCTTETALIPKILEKEIDSNDDQNLIFTVAARIRWRAFASQTAAQVPDKTSE